MLIGMPQLILSTMNRRSAVLLLLLLISFKIMLILPQKPSGGRTVRGDRIRATSSAVFLITWKQQDRNSSPFPFISRICYFRAENFIHRMLPTRVARLLVEVVHRAVLTRFRLAPSGRQRAVQAFLGEWKKPRLSIGIDADESRVAEHVVVVPEVRRSCAGGLSSHIDDDSFFDVLIADVVVIVIVIVIVFVHGTSLRRSPRRYATRLLRASDRRCGFR